MQVIALSIRSAAETHRTRHLKRLQSVRTDSNGASQAFSPRETIHWEAIVLVPLACRTFVALVWRHIAHSTGRADDSKRRNSCRLVCHLHVLEI
jgi:hypothetical protein